MTAPRGTRTEQVAQWMSVNGGTPLECARSLRVDHEQVKSAWKRIKRKLGWQAR